VVLLLEVVVGKLEAGSERMTAAVEEEILEEWVFEP
jgi:hypothetical protein